VHCGVLHTRLILVRAIAVCTWTVCGHNIILRDVLPSPQCVCRHASHIAINFRHPQVGQFSVTGRICFVFALTVVIVVERNGQLRLLHLDRVHLKSMCCALCVLAFGILRCDTFVVTLLNCRIYIVHFRVDMRSVPCSHRTTAHTCCSCRVTALPPVHTIRKCHTVRCAFISAGRVGVDVSRVSAATRNNFQRHYFLFFFKRFLYMSF